MTKLYLMYRYVYLYEALLRKHYPEDLQSFHFRYIWHVLIQKKEPPATIEKPEGYYKWLKETGRS